MDILDYAEKRAEDTLRVLRGSYDDLHERLQKVITALVGGAGAAGAFALAKFSAGGSTMEWATIGTLSVEWFLIAATAAVTGVRSQELSPGNGPTKIRSYFNDRLAEMPDDGDDAVKRALELTRGAELDRQQSRLTEYGKACIRRAIVLDRIYLASALSPIPALAALTLTYKP